MTDDDEKVEVKIPKGSDVDYLICRTARYVSKDGAIFKDLG